MWKVPEHRYWFQFKKFSIFLMQCCLMARRPQWISTDFQSCPQVQRFHQIHSVLDHVSFAVLFPVPLSILLAFSSNLCFLISVNTLQIRKKTRWKNIFSLENTYLDLAKREEHCMGPSSHFVAECSKSGSSPQINQVEMSVWEHFKLQSKMSNN